MTAQVDADLLAGRTTSSYRIRRTNETLNDGRAEFADVESSAPADRPMLDVAYRIH